MDLAEAISYTLEKNLKERDKKLKSIKKFLRKHYPTYRMDEFVMVCEPNAYGGHPVNSKGICVHKIKIFEDDRLKYIVHL